MMISNALVQLADNIWIFPHDPNPGRVQPNVGIITTPNHTILVDAGNSPRHARRIMIALDEIEAPPVSYVIYTHSHWDHVFGGMVFDSTTVAQELCRKQVSEMASRPWSNGYIQEEIMRNPSREASLQAMSTVIDDWRNFRIVQPQLVFSRIMRLYPDDMLIEIEHVGGLHAPDSAVVRIPQARTLFLGDCFYPPPMHLRKEGDMLNQPMMRMLVRDDLDIYVDGHGDPMTRDEFLKLANGEGNPVKTTE